MNTSESATPTFAVANPSDSILVHLARAALAPGTSGGVAAWPRLDLADPRQREFGDYELIEELGRGGMGVVYRARQKSLERDVAIKFIADWFADSSNVTRFLAEARAAARLLHPNIVPVHEVGSVEGVHYFSMPLIEGRSLESLLDDGALSTDAMIRLLLKLCEAIDYAHHFGLLHLDLKPANVLIDPRGEPQIADFGLARHMDDRGGVDAQEVSGTPSFMAPEQILIKQYRLTRATDIYALGAIMYLCLTDHSPHGEGAADDVIRRAAAGRIRPPRELNAKIPRDLDAICMKCLELQPGDRYKSAAELADDLRRVRDGLPVSVRRIGFVERVQRWGRREPKFAAAVSIAVLALLIGAAATTWQWKHASAERDRATIASEIGAHLFAYKGDEDKRTEDLLAWLRKRLPGDESQQADALTAFTASVKGQSADAAATLASKIVWVLGSDYRRQTIRALEAASDPYRHLYTALLIFNDTSNSKSHDEFAAAVKNALAEHPNDPLLWQIAAVYCSDTGKESHCPPQAESARQLVRLNGANMYSWMLLAMLSDDAQEKNEALHEAAQRSQINDYLDATYAAYAKAFETAAVPAPPLIAGPMRIVAPNDRAESGIAWQEAAQFAIPPYPRLIDQCGTRTGAAPVTDPQVVADCLAVGQAMTYSKGGLITQMIGVAMVTALAKGKPEADAASQRRKLYTYLDDVVGKLSIDKQMSYPYSRLLHDNATDGEMAALQNRARFFGLPDQPPADWKPDDPIVLLSARQRYDYFVALNSDAAALVSHGKYDEATTLLAPAEETMRIHFKDNWQRVRYLTVLARARIGQREFAAAQTALDDAWKVAADFGPTSRDARDCAHAYVDLYTVWSTAEPGKSYDIKASEWQRRLAGLEAAKDD